MHYNSLGKTNTTCSCQHQKAKTGHQKRFPWIVSLGIAILPKCPFCIFGYSSALTMCSGVRLHSYQPTLWSFLPLLLAVAVMVSFAFNFKGQKTIAALALTVLGTALLYHSTYVSGSLTVYFIAVSIIFLGVFVNGSFLYFYRKFEKQFLSRFFGEKSPPQY